MSGSKNFEKDHLAQCKYFSAYCLCQCSGMRPHAVVEGEVNHRELSLSLCVVASVTPKQPVDVLRFDLKVATDDGQILRSHCSKVFSIYNRDEK